jgi:hypothetical protein
MTPSDNLEIYVVTQGDYSDYHIVAVFQEKAMAEQFVALRNSLLTVPDSDFALAIYDIDTQWALQELKHGVIWECWTSDLKGTLKCHVPYATVGHEGAFSPRRVEHHPGNPGWEVAVHARDEQEALKIATEKIAQAKAEREGIA